METTEITKVYKVDSKLFRSYEAARQYALDLLQSDITTLNELGVKLTRIDYLEGVIMVIFDDKSKLWYEIEELALH
jgi:SOS response regulatory protein OraA/RecX